MGVMVEQWSLLEIDARLDFSEDQTCFCLYHVLDSNELTNRTLLPFLTKMSPKSEDRESGEENQEDRHLGTLVSLIVHVKTILRSYRRIGREDSPGAARKVDWHASTRPRQFPHLPAVRRVKHLAL